MEPCIYRVLGFGFRFSPPIWSVVNPRGGLAIWLAGKIFPRRGNRLKEIQKSINAQWLKTRPERNRSLGLALRWSNGKADHTNTSS
jgi:hypothetical protein